MNDNDEIKKKFYEKNFVEWEKKKSKKLREYIVDELKLEGNLCYKCTMEQRNR